MKQYILYNPLSASGRGEELVRGASVLLGDSFESEYVDVTALASWEALFERVGADDRVILCGGDGTVHRFANETRGLALPDELYYFASGTGNDLMHDLGLQAGSSLLRLKPYLESLPFVEVNGGERVFINNVSFGIDGYCCEQGDRLRAQGKKVDYTKIALRGLLGGFHPVNAVVTVDGVRREYRRVWMAPAMNGRYCGGGMMVTPQQDRNAADGCVSAMVLHSAWALTVLTLFPGVFKGRHVRHKRFVEIVKGHDVCVEFDRPTPMQIDGETISGVLSYRVHTAKR